MFKKLKNIIISIFAILAIVVAGYTLDQRSPEVLVENLGGYSASDILGLAPALWIDFSDASTVTTVSGNISQVNDKSGNGLNYTQGTVANRPGYPSAVQNGLNVARFDGGNDRLSLGSSDLGRNLSGATIYVVRRPDVVNNGGANQGLFAVTTPTSSLNRLYVYLAATTGALAHGGRTDDSDGFAAAFSSTAASTSLFEVQVGVFDYANTDLFTYLNKSLLTSNTSYQSATATSNTASNNSQIGATANGGTQFFDGDIGEILVFHAKHNDSIKQNVTDYLMVKWGLAQKRQPTVIIF